MAYRQDAAAVPQSATGAPMRVNPPDKHIWGIYGCLVFISIIELYSASSFEISTQGLYAPLKTHLIFLAASFVIMLTLQNIHYAKFVIPTKVLFWFSGLSMIYVAFFGKAVNGAKRAIDFGFFSFQPPEFVKLSTVLMVAYLLGTSQLKKNPKLRSRGIWHAAFAVLFMGATLFTQGLTNTIILMVISVAMMLMGSFDKQALKQVFVVYFCVAVVAVGAKAVMSHMASKDNKPKTELVDAKGNVLPVPEGAYVGNGGGDTRMTDDTWGNRIRTFFSRVPKYEEPITPENIQEMRSYMAQAHGGLTGVGPGNSRETSRLPLAFSDYIFAIVLEDLGFLFGGCTLMVLYLWLLARAYFIFRNCNHIYPGYLVLGCALLITFQALCHMAIVTGAFPVSGQPLPLFSKGGSAMITTSMALGVMLSVSRYSLRDKNATAHERRVETESLPEELRAENVSKI